MEKLVQRNYVLRFKEGEKILYAEEGAVARWQRRIRHPLLSYLNLDARTPIPDPFRYLDNKIGKAILWANKTFVVRDGYIPENGGTTNNKIRLLYYQSKKLLPTTKTPLNGLPIVDTNLKLSEELTTEKKSYGWKENIRERVIDGVLKGIDNAINKSRRLILDNTIKEGLYKGYSKSLGSNTPTPISFSQAFRQARNSGLKEFTWRGGRYTTETAEEKKSRLQLNNIKNKVSFQVPITTETTQLDWDRLNNAKEKVWLGATFAKQGGSLASRNPVQRFKQKHLNNI